MEYRIETIKEKKLTGKSINMSLSDNKTFQLWQQFMPQRRNIDNKLNPNLFSVEIFPGDINLANADTIIEKWAAVEVSSFDNIPEGFDGLTIKGGLYAVFTYKGTADKAFSIFQYILETWLLQEGYTFDNNRFLFEIMPENYNPNDSGSTEEIWIPINTN